MSTENAAALETSGNDRRIDPERIERALTDDMTIRDHAPGQYLVARDGDGHDEHLVDVEAGACDGADAHYRDVVCVHMVRAAVHHLFVHGADTRLVARVAGAIADLGCPHGNDCDGPCGTGQYPCPACVRSTNTGDWTVYQRLVAREPAAAVDRGEAAVTDGGVVEKQPPDDEDGGAARFDVSDVDTVVIDTYENERMTFAIEDEPAEAWSFALVDGDIVFVNDHHKEGLAELKHGRLDKEPIAWDDLDGQRARVLEDNR